jgi:uncharacterized protein YndB with AHSA1/START domain
MKKVLVVLLVIVVAVLGFIATRPNRYHVERSVTIAAPSSTVFPKVNDLHQWEAWSPWEKLDPQMKRTFEGAESGVGAGYHWVGNDKVGEGRMAITESKPNEHVRIHLNFIKPFESSSVSTFTLVPEGPGTKVTWTMDGDHNFMSKTMSLFMNMDKMIGGDFEKGLATLKSVSEADALKPADAGEGAVEAPTSSDPAVVRRGSSL